MNDGSFSEILSEIQQENDNIKILEEEIEGHFPIVDVEDVEIIMHRDAHFSGSFDLMIEYYSNMEKRHHDNEFNVARIKNLLGIEKKLNNNIASLILSGSDMERVARARNAYRKLKEIYEIKNPQSRHSYLIADLILSEHPEPIIDTITKEGPAIVPSLIAVLKSDDFYDPLFPGYGNAAALAVQCLGNIGDASAIIPLFEYLESNDFALETFIVKAMVQIGDQAKKFLLKVLQSRPISQDNVRASIMLSEFEHDHEIINICSTTIKK